MNIYEYTWICMNIFELCIYIKAMHLYKLCVCVCVQIDTWLDKLSQSTHTHLCNHHLGQGIEYWLAPQKPFWASVL